MSILIYDNELAHMMWELMKLNGQIHETTYKTCNISLHHLLTHTHKDLEDSDQKLDI